MFKTGLNLSWKTFHTVHIIVESKDIWDLIRFSVHSNFALGLRNIDLELKYFYTQYELSESFST